MTYYPTIVTNSFTGITIDGGSSSAGIGSTSTIDGTSSNQPQRNNVAEFIAQLSQSSDGFDFKVIPCEPVLVTWPAPWSFTTTQPRIGTLLIKAIIGSTKPDVIFQYGQAPANVRAYSRQVSNESLANAVVALSSGGDETAFASDTASIDTRCRSDAIISSDLTDGGQLATLAAEHLAVRKQPQKILNFTPFKDASPAPLVDYDVGDTVRTIITVEGSPRVDAMVRVYGIDIDIDDMGSENTSLSLVLP